VAVTPLAGARRGLLIAGVAGAVAALDQATQTLALQHLKLGAPRHLIWTLQFNLTFNTGIAFSQATGATVLVTVVALVVLAALVVIARRSSGTGMAVAFGLIIGGAVGNLIDRIVRHHSGGGVIDFIDFQWFPIFNLADASITVGVLLAAGRSLLSRDR
jgi:signal peptidase II